MKKIKLNAIQIMALSLLVFCALAFFIMDARVISSSTYASAKLTTIVNGQEKIIDMSEDEFKKLVGVMNFFNKRTHTSNDVKCEFQLHTVDKEGGTMLYEFDFGLTDSIILYIKKEHTKGQEDYYEIDRRILTGKREKMLALEIFKDYYYGGSIIEPIAFSGENILRSKSKSDHWSYMDLDGNWKDASSESSEQITKYSILGKKVNVVLPGYVDSAQFEIFDEKNNLLTHGDEIRGAIEFPEYDRTYKLIVYANYNYALSQERKYGSTGMIYEGYKGRVVSEYWIECGQEASNTCLEVSSKFVDLEYLLSSFDYDYLLDTSGDRLQVTINQRNPIEATPLAFVKSIEVSPVTYELVIDGKHGIRQIYEFNGHHFVDLDQIIFDLSLDYKIQNGEVVAQESKRKYPCSDFRTNGEGYVTNEGKWVFPPILQNAEAFINGYAIVSIDDTPVNEDFINARLSGAEFSQFSDSLQATLVSFYTPDVYGLLDEELNVAIEVNYDSIYNMNDEYLSVTQGNKTQIYNYDLEKVKMKTLKDQLYESDDMKNRYDAIYRFHDGLAVVRKSGAYPDNYGVINEQGDVVIPCIFRDIEDFSDNKSLILIIENGIRRYAFVGNDGNLISSFEYDYASKFYHGYAIVGSKQEDNLDSYIKDYYYIDDHLNYLLDKNGQPIKAFINLHDDADDFLIYNGLLLSYENYKYGYRNLDGDLLVDYKYEKASPLKNGMARVAYDDDEGSEYLLDSFGNEIMVEDLFK